mmetsp:Transcript_2698/g.9821  ORF Transcript_2698/g.9821 Transcript_2698/m.9821 type:complete len:118 (+) Transcript_2698:2393-2746(+)
MPHAEASLSSLRKAEARELRFERDEYKVSARESKAECGLDCVVCIADVEASSSSSTAPTDVETGGGSKYGCSGVLRHPCLVRCHASSGRSLKTEGCGSGLEASWRAVRLANAELGRQ